MSTESVRTQDGYKNLLIGGSGVAATFLAAADGATIPDNAQVANLSGTGGGGVSFTAPAPANYKGSGQGLLCFVTASAGNGVTINAAAGTTIGGLVSSGNLEANTLILLIPDASNPNNWLISGFTA